MDNSASKEQDVVLEIDLESGTGIVHTNEEACVDPGLDKKLAKTMFLKLCDGLSSKDDNSVKSDPLNVNEGSLENNVKCKKASGAKKPPRPPRPPGGFSLDASDKKLIKELAELAIIKRARNERMRALKQKKALKISSSSSSSSHGSLFAMLVTIVFFLIILLQGRNPGATFQGSPQMAQRNENGLLGIQKQLHLSASDSI